MASIPHSTSLPRRAKTGGRRAGTPNRFTRDFRDMVAGLLDANQDNLSAWLGQVANGDPRTGRPPDPARALDLIAKLAEYAVPKMTRQVVEQTASSANVITIEIEFVSAPPRNTVAMEMPESSDPIEVDTVPDPRIIPGKKHS